MSQPPDQPPESDIPRADSSASQPVPITPLPDPLSNPLPTPLPNPQAVPPVPSTPLPDPPASQPRLIAIARGGVFSASTLDRALLLLGNLPDVISWQRFISVALLSIGAALSISGIFALFVLGWMDIPRLARLGLMELLVVIALIAATRLSLDKLSGKIALFAASVLIGALLLTVGIVYDTGGTPFALFFNWMLFIVGWVLLSRFGALWFFFLVLLDITLAIWWDEYQTRNAVSFMTWTLFFYLLAFIHATWLIGWEAAARRGVEWLSNKWFPSLIGLALLTWLTVPTIYLASGISLLNEQWIWAAPFLYVGVLGLFGVLYIWLSHNLFMLTAASVSVLAIITTLQTQIVWRYLLDLAELGWIALGFMIIMETVIMVLGLIFLARRWGIMK